MEIKQKKCFICKEMKDVFDFGFRRSSHDNFTSKCKACEKKHRKESEISKIRKVVGSTNSSALY